MLCSRLKKRRPARTLEVSEAAREITRLVMELLPLSERESLSEIRLEFYIKKIVLDILDYCHISYFPEALIYSAVDLIVKRIKDESASYIESSETSLTSTNMPISEITQDDVTFKFAVNNIDLSGCLADLDFESIKEKLRMYRRLITW